jgi:hypothetical protein
VATKGKHYEHRHIIPMHSLIYVEIYDRCGHVHVEWKMYELVQ